MSDIDDLRDLVESNQNYNVEAHVVLQTAIDNEREMRIAGDAASIAAVTTVTNSLQLTNQQLSQEVLDRSAGDLVSDNNITALTSRFISEWESINQDLTTLKVNTNSSLKLLDQRIDATNLALEVQKTDLMEIIDDRFNYVNNKTTQLQADVDKYLVLLQDITMDSSQITMDNGEINMGAWTILSQAREWDLEILRGFKNFTAETEQNINDALEDLQNKLPIEQDIIDKAIEALSNSQTIKDLDAAIKDNGIEIAQVNDALIAEAQRISNDIINLSQAKTNELKAEVGEVNSRVEKEVTDRIDAVQREARIRQEQINQQTVDMNAEIDERVTELTTQVNDVLNNAVDGFNQQVTELKNQDAYILDDLTTYKATNDDRVTGVVNQTTINTNNITQQASQLSAVQTTLGTKNRTFTQSSQPSSIGLVTGDTWINTTSGKNFEVKVWTGSEWSAVTDPRISANATNIANQSTQITNLQNGVTANTNSINALNIDVSNIKAESVTFAKAKAVEDLTANVSIIDGKVSNNTSKISTLESTAEQLQEDINSKATSAAFEALKSDVQITKDNVSSNSSKITQLDNSVSTIENKIPTLATNSALDATNSSIQVEKGRIDNTISRLNTVDTAIAGKANQSSVDTIANRVTATENENTAQGNRLTSVEGSVSSLNQTTGANSSAISGLTNDVSAINQDLNAKAQRFDRIESNIRGLSLDTTPNLNQRNKWAFISVKKPYPYMAQSIVPDYSYLNKFVAYASTYLNEDGTLPSVAEYENAIHYFRTALYVNETKTITLNYFHGDDAHAVYLNNELIRTETGVAASALTLNLKQGWNLLDVIVNNGGGPGGFSYGSALQSLVDVMAATRLVNVDQDANASATQALTTRVTSNEQAIATKAESSLVNNLQAQVNQNKADAAQTYVTKADNNQSEATLGNQLTAAYKAADSTVLNSAANDATTKANQAYNDSKAYVEQYAYGKANADQAVAGAIANYNAQLIIGANNLYEGTQNWEGVWENMYRYESVSETYKGFLIKRTSLDWGGLAKSMVFDSNTEYTLSAWIRKSQADVAIVFWYNGTDSQDFDKPIPPNEWVRVSHTFKGDGILGNGRFEKRQNGSTGFYDICGLKLERGNKATDWSPAPEDVASDINKVQANLTNFQEAQANVDLAQTNRLNSAESQLGSNTARIVNVEQTYAKQDQVAALARTGLESEYKNYADNAVGNLQIGGENLLLNSDFSKSPLKMAYLGGEFNTVELTAAPQYREASLSNQTYLTVSIWYTQLDSINVNKPFESLVLGRSSITADSWDVRLWTRDSSIKVVKEGSFYKLTGTVMIPSNGVLFAANPKFILISGYGCNLYKVKVEKGTKSTDWSPNPLDITSVINWQIIDEPTDLNNMTATGKYLLKNITANSPMNAWAYLVVDAAQPDRILQTMWKDNDLTQKFERNKFDSTWRDWLKAVNNEEFNTYKSTVETIYQTKSDATSTTADLINRLTSKANQSGLDALSADVANNYYTKAQTDSVAAGVVNRYKAELGNIINYTVVSRGNDIGGVGYLQNAEGGWVVGGARSYTLVVFNGDGTVNWSRSYDIFGQGSPANQVLYDDVNALPNGVYALIFTSDEPASGRDANLIFPALRMLGGTREVNDKLGYRGSYMLIGRKGMVEGTAVEMVAPSNQTITYGLQFVNGVPVGIGNTPTAMPSQFASATAVQNIQADVSNINGQISSQAYSITELHSDLNKVGVKLTETTEVVDGVKAVSTVSVDNNGFISGYGLISQLVNGVVQSAFGVNADYFYVGTSNSNKKKPFMVVTSPQTINDVTYPAGTWIDVALIANATIGTAHIADAAITNAKIANLDASKITTGTLDANRIGANTITAEKLIVGDMTNLWGNQYFLNGAYPLNSYGRTRIAGPWNEVKGNGVQCWGRDHVAPYSTRIPVKAGDTIVIEYFKGLNGGPWKRLGVGLWCYNKDNYTSEYQYPEGTVIADLGGGWYKCRATLVLNNPNTAYACLFVQIEQEHEESNPAYWSVGDLSIRKAMGGELIVNGAVTADKISVGSLSAISANLGTIKVDTANIADSAITNAKIGVAEIDTLRIRGRAVTVPYYYTDTNPVSIDSRFGDFPVTSSGSRTVPVVSAFSASGFTPYAEVFIVCDVGILISGLYDSANGEAVSVRLIQGYYDTASGNTPNAKRIDRAKTITYYDDPSSPNVGTRWEVTNKSCGAFSRKMTADAYGNIALSLWVSAEGNVRNFTRLIVKPETEITWYVQELKR